MHCVSFLTLCTMKLLIVEHLESATVQLISENHNESNVCASDSIMIFFIACIILHTVIFIIICRKT